MRAAGGDWKPGLLQASVEKASVGATHGATSPGDTRTTETQVCSQVFEGSDGTIGAERRFGHDQEMHTATAGGMRFLVAWKQVHKVAGKTLACRHYQESQEEAARQKGKRRKFSRTLVSSAEVDSELC